MNTIFKFGEDVDGYSIPVLNEREIRAAAGILFLMMYIAIHEAGAHGNFLMLKYAVVIFLTDISLRVFVNPKFAPSLIVGRLIVRNQVPEYVGARQKKVAWIIGVVLGATMFIHLVVLNAFSPITGIICLVCLIFLFFEAVFGICIGCKMYSLIYKDKAQHCPGEVCDVSARQNIQKTSVFQLLIVGLFIACIILTVFMFNDVLSIQPHSLFG